tara:strand:+ start:295 stop:537 length:243 start_codon:yes stop_codon:yes gene_type:complete
MAVPLKLHPILLVCGDLAAVEDDELQGDHKWPQPAYPIALLEFDDTEWQITETFLESVDLLVHQLSTMIFQTLIFLGLFR